MRKLLWMMLIVVSLATACNMPMPSTTPPLKIIEASGLAEGRSSQLAESDPIIELTLTSMSNDPNAQGAFDNNTPIPTGTIALPNETGTATVTVTNGPSPTVTVSPTITQTSTITVTPTITQTSTITSTPTVSPTTTATSVFSPTPTPTYQPTATKTKTAVPTQTPTTTPIPSTTPTPTIIPSPTKTNTPIPQTCFPIVDTSFESQVISLINQERAKVGVAPLTADSRLTSAARSHSQDMACNGFFSHTSPTTGSPFDRMIAHGYTYSWAGENIIAGYSTAAYSVAWWMASQAHKDNILNPNFIHIGVGYAYYESSAYGTYVTAVFGTP